MRIVYCVALLGSLVCSKPLLAQSPAAPAPAGIAAPNDAGPNGALARYVAKPDASYGWTVRREGKVGDVEYAELILTSQTWRDIPWKHQLFVIKPAQVRHPDHALLLIGGGSWREELAKPAAEGATELPRQAGLLAEVARQTGSPVAVLLQVPHQPLFGNKHEDQIIAYTCLQYIITGDETWPLLLPMVKSAVRGLDATTQFARDEWKLDVKRFTVMGASKRGWTTWLTAAVDPRVEAIAPMVIDMLNTNEQMKHQIDTWGRYSEQVGDYTELNLQKLLESEPGTRLQQITDPFSYRARIKQPKLIILGTNDRYWTLDALNLYWPQLTGENRVMYVPNQGHGINDAARLLGSVTALCRETTGEAKLPQLEWRYEKTDDGLMLLLKSDTKPHEVRSWSAVSATRDFRNAKWESQPAETTGDEHRMKLECPSDGCRAMFGEAVFNGESLPFFLSTTLRIVGPDGEIAPKAAP